MCSSRARSASAGGVGRPARVAGRRRCERARRRRAACTRGDPPTCRVMVRAATRRCHPALSDVPPECASCVRSRGDPCVRRAIGDAIARPSCVELDLEALRCSLISDICLRDRSTVSGVSVGRHRTASPAPGPEPPIHREETVRRWPKIRVLKHTGSVSQLNTYGARTPDRPDKTGHTQRGSRGEYETGERAPPTTQHARTQAPPHTTERLTSVTQVDVRYKS